MKNRKNWAQNLAAAKATNQEFPAVEFYETMGTETSAISTVQRLRRMYGEEYEFGFDGAVVSYRYVGGVRTSPAALDAE